MSAEKITETFTFPHNTKEKLQLKIDIKRLILFETKDLCKRSHDT